LGSNLNNIYELRRIWLSLSQKDELTGYDRTTIQKFLRKADGVSRGSDRPASPGMPYLEYRLKAGAWNAKVLLRDLRARGYRSGYTILKDWSHLLREAHYAEAVWRFKTSAGMQAQVDRRHLGYIEWDGPCRM
jgi:transposase